MKHIRKRLVVVLSVVILLACIPFGSINVVAETDIFVPDIPENDGVRNAILNAEQLANIAFTPLKSIPQKAADLPAGKEQKGLPYSSSRIEEGFVPNFVSFYTFMSALQNPNSYLYTVDLGELGNQNGDTYYGTVCSTFCTYALNVLPNYTTHQWQDIPGMITLPRQTVDALKLGDTICHKTSGHVVMVVGITRNEVGQVGEVMIAEAATTKAMVRKPYSAEEFSNKYPTDVYAYHRYTKIHEVEHIPFDFSSYRGDLIPRKGDKANWLVGTPVEIDLLSKSRYTSVEIYKDDSMYDMVSIGGQDKPADYTVYLRDWILNNNRATNRFVPIKGDIRITVEKDVQITFDFYNSSQQKIGSTGTWLSGDIAINDFAPDEAALFQPIVRRADNATIVDAEAIGNMVAIKISDGSLQMPIQFENYSLSSSHGGEVNNNMRCRSTFMPLQNVTIEADEDVQFYIYYYDANREYISNNGAWLVGSHNVLDGKPEGAAFFRLVIKNSASSVIDGNSYGKYAVKLSATIHGGVPEGGLDVLVLDDLEAGCYKARMTSETRVSDWCYWIVVDATATAVSTTNCREVQVTFSASNAEPLFVKWSGGKDNGTKHISVLNARQKSSGSAVCKYEMGDINDWQYGQYKIRVAFQTEYGVVHTPLQEVTTVGLHTFDNPGDISCNSCNALRVSNIPVRFGGSAVSEDVNGLAFRFDVMVNGMTIKEGTTFQANYTNAIANGHRLVSMGAIASNGVDTIDIPCAYLCACEENSVSFAVRIVDIPKTKFDVPIVVTPYQVVEIDGKETTLYGERQTASYNSVIQ